MTNIDMPEAKFLQLVLKPYIWRFLSSPQQYKVHVHPGISDVTMGSVFITDMNVMVVDSAMTGATNGIVVC